MSQWDTWLRELKRSGKGGIRLDCAHRSVNHVVLVNWPGDITGATLRAQVRSSPDADTSLADYTVTGPVVVDDVSTFTCTIEQADMAALPADADLDGVEEFPVDFLLTLAGGDEALLFGAILPVTGRVTEPDIS